MKITTKEIKQLIKEETAKVLEAYEVTDLMPLHKSGAPTSPEEENMDWWTSMATEKLFDSILTGGNIMLPTGETENLDGFLAALGNMAVTGGISGKEALAMVSQLGYAAEAAMSKVSQDFVDEDYIEDQKWESGEYDHLVDPDELEERKLTDAEEDKREEVAQAIEKDNPEMPKGPKMAIATTQAKKSAK